MVTFRVMRIQNFKDKTAEGWAVQRSDPGGFKIVVTRLYDSEQDALNEAARLTREASRAIMT